METKQGRTRHDVKDRLRLDEGHKDADRRHMLCILFKAEEASHGEFYIHKDNYTQQNTLTRIHLIEIDKSRKDLTIKETEYVMEE